MLIREPHIRTNIDTIKDHSKKLYSKVKSSNTKHKNLHKQNVNSSYIYIGNFSKHSSEPDTAELFSFRTSYLSENFTNEMLTRRKKRNFKSYAFITVPEKICNYLIKPNRYSSSRQYTSKFKKQGDQMPALTKEKVLQSPLWK